MTAVEWFAKQVLRARQLGFISNEKFNELLDQAKEMEKNDLENSYLQGFGQCDHDGVMDFHKYYKQTFKSE